MAYIKRRLGASGWYFLIIGIAFFCFAGKVNATTLDFTTSCNGYSGCTYNGSGATGCEMQSSFSDSSWITIINDLNSGGGYTATRGSSFDLNCTYTGSQICAGHTGVQGNCETVTGNAGNNTLTFSYNGTNEHTCTLNGVTATISDDTTTTINSIGLCNQSSWRFQSLEYPIPTPTLTPTPTGTPPTPTPTGTYTHQICLQPTSWSVFDKVNSYPATKNETGELGVNAHSYNVSALDLEVLKSRMFTGFRFYENFSIGEITHDFTTQHNFRVNGSTVYSSGVHSYSKDDYPSLVCRGYLGQYDFGTPLSYYDIFDGSGEMLTETGIDNTTSRLLALYNSTVLKNVSINGQSFCLEYKDTNSADTIDTSQSCLTGEQTEPPVFSCTFSLDDIGGYGRCILSQIKGFFTSLFTQFLSDLHSLYLAILDFIENLPTILLGAFVPTSSEQITATKYLLDDIVDNMKEKAPLAYIVLPIEFIDTFDFNDVPESLPIFEIPIGLPPPSPYGTMITLDMRPPNDVQTFINDTIKPIMRYVVDLAFIVLYVRLAMWFLNINIKLGSVSDDTVDYNEWQNTHR